MNTSVAAVSYDSRVDWTNVISVGSPLLVGALAFWGSRWGVQRQLDAAHEATRRQDDLEHRRWLRDRADATYLDVLTYVGQRQSDVIRAVERLRMTDIAN